MSTPYWTSADGQHVLYQGDIFAVLPTLPESSVHCVVTSPPYWGLRSYLPTEHDDKHREIGSEPTPDAYVQTMVEVFREVRRVLHDSGTVFLNCGDSYANSGRTENSVKYAGYSVSGAYADGGPVQRVPPGLKPKDLCLIPWRLAIALQADGWYVRSVICWAKKSCMPESVRDRPTNSWEPIFLLAKSSRYFYDAEVVKEPSETGFERERKRPNGLGVDEEKAGDFGFSSCGISASRNQRNVWHLGPEPYAEAHPATFPTEIPRRAIRAGTSAYGCCPQCYAPWVREVEKEGETTREKLKERGASQYANGQPKAAQGLDYAGEHGNNTRETRTLSWAPGCACGQEPVPCTVLDPFAGSGTTAIVAHAEGRRSVGIDLSAAYCALAVTRLETALRQPLLFPPVGRRQPDVVQERLL